ncbi:MAG: amidase [Dehalococcoidia bacterium]|jgi:aspartyl-tRNA(Asn)/glutamyl-tRNA(Gln) amidotransferase subunit A|nr:amidase [Dehalococcoidia bacterium]
MTEHFNLTAAKAAKRIKNRELSPVELVESLLIQYDALEPSLNAWVYLDREAVLADAQQKQEELEKGGSIGPLHGVPIGLKDIYYTAGIPTTACSKVYEGFVPEYDATTVALLKGAGAIMMGKTVTTEFACMDPSPTKNPWNPAHTPGGSSSGSAVAVATRMCPAALGSQTVGSVLRPASYNGVVGFKPTFGRVSRYGVIPVSWSLDHVGWMARSVEDIALLMQVMSVPDPQEPITARQPSDDFMTGLGSPAAPRIGLIRRFFYDNADEETRQHTDGVVEQLSRAGASVEEISLPDSIDTAIADQRIIMAVEAAAFHQPMYERQSQDYQPMLREMLRRGLETDGQTYSRALERRQQFTAEMQALTEKADVLLTPSTPTPALADITNTGNTMFQGPWTSCGLPVITIPSGLAASGLPFGIQLAAAPFSEPKLLAAARWCEDVLGVELAPPVNRS